MMKLLPLVGFVALAAVAVDAPAADTPAPASASTSSSSTQGIPFTFDNGEITAMIAAYSKATGRKFIVDPGVRGKITALIPGNVSTDEAYNILCDALAINGFSVLQEDDTYIVKSARNIQRDMVPTLTKLPPARPNIMVTYILTPKYAKVEDINRNLRILPSKDGEMTPFAPSNTLIITDYSANINRIATIISQLDTPEAAKYKAPAHPVAPSFHSPTTEPMPPPVPGAKNSAPGKRSAKGDELDRLFED